MGVTEWISDCGKARLILGDCFEVLPTMQPESVDVCITDPPYSEKTHKGAKTNKMEFAIDSYKQGGCKLVTFDHLPDALFADLCKSLITISKRWVVMTCDHSHAALVFGWSEFVRLGAWLKVNPMPQITGDRPGSGHESVLILHRLGRKKWNGGGKPATWIHTVSKSTEICQVPTQKPLPLIIDFISLFSDENETILDPFMGSGTTGVACVRTGRKFIGIEKEPRYFEIAKRRIIDELNRFPLLEQKTDPAQLSLLPDQH